MDFLAVLLVALAMVCCIPTCLNAERNLMAHTININTTSLGISSTSFNVVRYGAVGDGKTDDSQAFLKAWNMMCSASTGIPTMVVPKGLTFLVKPVIFKGPCLAQNISVKIMGTIIAPNTTDAWKGIDQSLWMAFTSVSGLRVSGSGVIDGRGSDWWDQSCRYHPGNGCTKLAPTTMKFLKCNQSHLSNVQFINSPQTHVLVMGCTGFYINGIVINSPGHSPNTDGIHIQSAQDMLIQDAKISSGDDCISIGDYTSNIVINDVLCGPGHGISIGSIGKDGSFSKVENIHVRNASFTNTTNGVRIKTWQTGKGYCQKISFKRINFTNVENPIIIDQNYCSVRGACKELPTGIQISDVEYADMVGTSSTEMAINFNCSSSFPCTGISLKSIKLSSATPGQTVSSACYHVHGNVTGLVIPNVLCIQN